jgi:cytochrome c peroxidase
MKLITAFCLICLCIFSSAFASSAIDETLRDRIKFFQINPLNSLPQQENRAQIELGKRLFMEPNLSGNKNISCLSCHQPMKGSGDGLPLSHTQDNSGILRRNSISIFNAGRPGHTFMFWDGRVHLEESTHTFSTPEKNLPAEITSVMTSALAAQALFPMVSTEEMKGRTGENEIADSKNNAEAWDKILDRLKKEENSNGRFKNYSDLFKAAYPDTPVEKINIGHVAEAIGRFEREQFQTTGSPFNQYLKGNNDAMTEKQKRGLLVFIERGKCIACHQGGELGLNSFFASVGVPQWGAKPMHKDQGRGEINNETFRNYFFRTPSLLNVGLTAPYMHNGAFKTLREVINHYSNIKISLSNFKISESTRSSLPVEVEVLNDNASLNEIFNSIQAPFLRNGLNFSESEKDDLEEFLSSALTDPAWKASPLVKAKDKHLR